MGDGFKIESYSMIARFASSVLGNVVATGDRHEPMGSSVHDDLSQLLVRLMDPQLRDTRTTVGYYLACAGRKIGDVMSHAYTDVMQEYRGVIERIFTNQHLSERDIQDARELKRFCDLVVDDGWQHPEFLKESPRFN